MAVTLSIKEWLQGNVGVTVPDKTLAAVMWNHGLRPDAGMCEVDPQMADECLADVYWWVSSLPSNKGKIEDSDGQWKHIDGGQILSESDKSWYRGEANRLRAKWGLPLLKSATVKLINL